MKKGTIELTGMQFHAFHGCLPEEREKGNLFVVDFRCEYDIFKASRTDCLEDTLDYGLGYDLIAAEMAVPSNLLEHVAGRIARAVREAYPGIKAFSVSVSKKNPPVPGRTEWSKVTIECDNIESL